MREDVIDCLIVPLGIKIWDSSPVEFASNPVDFAFFGYEHAENIPNALNLLLRAGNEYDSVGRDAFPLAESEQLFGHPRRTH